MTSTFLRSMLVAGAAVAALSVAACNKPAPVDNAANSAAVADSAANTADTAANPAASAASTADSAAKSAAASASNAMAPADKK